MSLPKINNGIEIIEQKQSVPEFYVTAPEAYDVWIFGDKVVVGLLVDWMILIHGPLNRFSDFRLSRIKLLGAVKRIDILKCYKRERGGLLHDNKC